MRKLFVGALVCALAGSAVATAVAGHRPGHPTQAQSQQAKVTICHRTSSSTRPYTKIVVSQKAVAKHVGHHQDIVGLPGQQLQCPTTAVTPSKGGRKLTATATTSAGTLTFTLRSLPGLGQICYTLSVTGATSVSSATIVRATGGALVATLSAPTTGPTSGCVNLSRAVVREILRNPAGFVVSVQTGAGALQATLGR